MKAQFSGVNKPRAQKRPEGERKPRSWSAPTTHPVGTPINLPSTKSEALPAVKPFVQHRAPSKKPESDIKRDYRTTLMLGLILSLGIVILAFRADIQADSDEFNLSLSEQEVVLMEEIQQTEQVERPPPPPRPPVPVEVPDDTILEDEALDLDVTLDMDGAVTDLPPPPPPPVEQVEELPEPEIFVAVEQMPEIIGGDNKVYEYLEYPELARQAGMQGLVIVAIVVDELGIPNSPTIARSAGEVLDRAARDAVLKLRFIPGRQRGRAVKVRMSVPIRFELRFVR